MRLGDRVQLVGDDLFVTHSGVIARAAQEKIGNAAIVKLNQIGTVSEALAALAAARRGGFGTVVSHRSGDTSDDFIADLAVASSCGQIKAGAPCRGERVAKYNQLLRIEEQLGPHAWYAGATPFRRIEHETGSGGERA
jgi:enolase